MRNETDPEPVEHRAPAILAALAGKPAGRLWHRIAPAVAPVGDKLARALALKSEDGVTAIEYGLIAALIAVAIIVAVTLVGTQLSATFNMVAGHLGSAPSL